MSTKRESSASADRSKRLRWLLSRALFTLAATVLITPLLLAWVFTSALVDVPCQGLFLPQDDAAFLLSFTDPAGDPRRGWLSVGSTHPERLIIVLPGLAGNTSEAAADARMLAAAGYSTYVYEHRTCADSRAISSTGYAESRDLLAAYAMLEVRGDYEQIAVMGFSEGGTAALLAAAEEPGLAAVVAMGGYASLRGQMQDAAEDSWRRFLAPLFEMMLGLRGVDVGASEPVAVVGQIAPRPLLLVYGSHEAANGEALYAAAGPGAGLWIVEGAGHGGYRESAGAGYEERITAFFRDALDGQ